MANQIKVGGVIEMTNQIKVGGVIEMANQIKVVGVIEMANHETNILCFRRTELGIKIKSEYVQYFLQIVENDHFTTRIRPRISFNVVFLYTLKQQQLVSPSVQDMAL